MNLEIIIDMERQMKGKVCFITNSRSGVSSAVVFVVLVVVQTWQILSNKAVMDQRKENYPWITYATRNAGKIKRNS